jgi:uncharacterized protein YoxC
MESIGSMTSLKQLKFAQKLAVQQQEVLRDLEHLVADIERTEKTINDLKTELEAANAKYPSPRSTRDDVGYLTELLACAKKKLAWEKQMASLQKKTPEILEKINRVMNDPANPPEDAVRAAMARALQGVQAAMERLQNAKVS